MKPIDLNNPIPYYIQVEESLKQAIEAEEWKPGDQIPGEPNLCNIYGVSRTVIRQALGELEHEALIYKLRGKGTFVAEPKIVENLVQKLTGFYEDMSDRGYPPVSQVLKQHVKVAEKKEAVFLQIRPGTQVIEIERLRFVEDLPLVLVTTYIPYEMCMDLVNVDLTRQSLYSALERQFGLTIARGRRTIESVAANVYEAELLQVEVGAPLMLLDSVSFLADGKPIEYYHALHRGDRSRFEVELIRVRERN
jgi:GntR family transcriptional regulator